MSIQFSEDISFCHFLLYIFREITDNVVVEKLSLLLGNGTFLLIYLLSGRTKYLPSSELMV